MRNLLGRTCGAVLIALLGMGPVWGADFAREQHAWARFLPGSWKLVRVTTQTFDAAGKPLGTSVTLTKTTLLDVTEDSFTLKVESTTEVGGKRIVAKPTEIKQQFNGATPGQTAQQRSLGDGHLVIEGRSYPCKLQQFEVSGPNGKTVTKTYLSSDVDPYVLRRESSMLDAANKVTGGCILEVTAVGKPNQVLSETLPTSRIRLVSTHATGKEETDAINALDVPGGIISHDSRELDATGKVVSQSKLELVDYEAWCEGRETVAPRRFRLLPRLRDHFRPMSFRSDDCQWNHAAAGRSLLGRLHTTHRL